MLKLVVYFLMIFSFNAAAGPIDALEFKDKTEEQRYFRLIEELRCLKCQNSNIAGSNADLAKDLRRKVYDMIVNQKMSDDAIKEWMMARYGDFVLYKPPLKPTTYILWGLPAILGIIALFVVISRFKVRKLNDAESLSSEQQQKVNEALE